MALLLLSKSQLFTQLFTFTFTFLYCYFLKHLVLVFIKPSFFWNCWLICTTWVKSDHTHIILTEKTDFNYRRSFQFYIIYITSSQTKMIMHIDEVWTQTSFIFSFLLDQKIQMRASKLCAPVYNYSKQKCSREGKTMSHCWHWKMLLWYASSFYVNVSM